MPEVQLLTRQLGGERRPGVEVNWRVVIKTSRLLRHHQQVDSTNQLSTRVLYEPTVVFGSHVLTSKTTY